MPEVKKESNKKFLTIVDGKLRQKTDSDNPKAIKREYETPKGEKGVKWEIVMDGWKGLVHDIRVEDGKFGEDCQLVFIDSVITVKTDSKYFQDIIAKLMNLDINKEIEVVPYSFTTEDGKKRSGLTVYQEGQKTNSYYFDGKKNINGMPDFTGNKDDKDDWKAYFIQVKKFLKGEVEKLTKKIDQKLRKTGINKVEQAENKYDNNEQEINIEDLPF